MLHMNDQSWNNSLGSAAELFPAQTDHQSWAFLTSTFKQLSAKPT